MSTAATITDRVCVACGASWTLPAATAAWFTERGLSQPRRCEPCRREAATRRRRGEMQTRVCSSCGVTFSFDPAAFAGLHAPGRCGDCRAAQRARLVTAAGVVDRVVTTCTTFCAFIVSDDGQHFYWRLKRDQYVPRGARVRFAYDPQEPAGREDGRLRHARDVVEMKESCQ